MNTGERARGPFVYVATPLRSEAPSAGISSFGGGPGRTVRETQAYPVRTAHIAEEGVLEADASPATTCARGIGQLVFTMLLAVSLASPIGAFAWSRSTDVDDFDGTIRYKVSSSTGDLDFYCIPGPGEPFLYLWFAPEDGVLDSGLLEWRVDGGPIRTWNGSNEYPYRSIYFGPARATEMLDAMLAGKKEILTRHYRFGRGSKTVTHEFEHPFDDSIGGDGDPHADGFSEIALDFREAVVHLEPCYSSPLLSPSPTPSPTPAPTPAPAPRGNIEIPGDGSDQSGIGVMSGWTCAKGKVRLRVDGGQHVLVAASGTARDDTRATCNNDGANGFSYLLNYALLGDGEHTVDLVVAGVVVDSSTFSVSTFGTNRLVGESGAFVLDFAGREVTVRWDEGMQNFVISKID